jgi:hypothetical protein
MCFIYSNNYEISGGINIGNRRSNPAVGHDSNVWLIFLQFLISDKQLYSNLLKPKFSQVANLKEFLFYKGFIGSVAFSASMLFEACPAQSNVSEFGTQKAPCGQSQWSHFRRRRSAIARLLGL